MANQESAYQSSSGSSYTAKCWKPRSERCLGTGLVFTYQVFRSLEVYPWRRYSPGALSSFFSFLGYDVNGFVSLHATCCNLLPNPRPVGQPTVGCQLTYRTFSFNWSSQVFAAMVENSLTQSVTHTVTATQQTSATVSFPALALHEMKTKPPTPRLVSVTP